MFTTKMGDSVFPESKLETTTFEVPGNEHFDKKIIDRYINKKINKNLGSSFTKVIKHLLNLQDKLAIM